MSSELSTALGVGRNAVRATSPERVSPLPAANGKGTPQSGETLPRGAVDVTEKTEANQEEILRAVDRLKEQAIAVGKDLSFEVDKESGYTVITVVDPATDEIVRQIPSEEVVERARQNNGEISLVEELA